MLFRALLKSRWIERESITTNQRRNVLVLSQSANLIPAREYSLLTLISTSSIRTLCVLLGLLLLTAGSSHAVLSGNLNGNISLSSVQSRSNDDTRSTFRQEFTGTWFRSLSQYLTFRTSMRYYRLSYDLNQEEGLWRKETQPTLQLTWDHPKVSISANARRRKNQGTSNADLLTQETFDLGFITHARKYGLMSMRYDYNNWYGQPNTFGRNILDQQLNANYNYQHGALGADYRFTQERTDNRVSLLETNQTHHLLRLTYSRATAKDGRFRMSGDYSLSYRSQSDELPSSGNLLYQIAIARALYGDKEEAELGQLEPRPDLNDGNIATPVTPWINIGTGMANQSLGVDIGVQRQISGLYIYTNVISDQQMTWRVYTSSDNLTWTAHELNPEIRFDASVKRYEVLFPSVEIRYVKAINSGFNQAGEVLVTEIQAITEVPASGKTSQQNVSHTLNLTGAYKINDRLSTTADISYQREPSVGLFGTRNNLYNSGTLLFKHTDKIMHTVRLQHSIQLTRGDVANLRDQFLMYSVNYKPLPTLGLTGTASDRRSWSDSSPDTDIQQIKTQFNADPLYGLKIHGEWGYSRSRRHLLAQTSGTWDRSVSIDAKATRSLEADLSYTHQVTRIKETGLRYLRDQYGFSLRWRLTSKLSARGNVDWSRGSSHFLAQEFGAGWNFNRNLNISFLYRLSDDINSYRSERYTARFNWRIGSRTSLYLSINDNDFSQAAGRRTKTMQMGLRSGF